MSTFKEPILQEREKQWGDATRTHQRIAEKEREMSERKYTIPEAAVEAAARAMYEHRPKHTDPARWETPWDEVPEGWKQGQRAAARVVLEAALTRHIQDNILIPEPVKVASTARGRHLTHWQIKSSMQAQKIQALQEEIARLIIDRDQARSDNAFNTYQKKTAQTAIYPRDQALQYLIPGLAAEAGEVAGKWAKIIRDQGGAYDQDDEEAIIKEVGDVLWMIARIAAELGVSLDVVAERNLKKLADRKNRGVLGGSGDNR